MRIVRAVEGGNSIRQAAGICGQAVSCDQADAKGCEQPAAQRPRATAAIAGRSSDRNEGDLRNLVEAIPDIRLAGLRAELGGASTSPPGYRPSTRRSTGSVSGDGLPHHRDDRRGRVNDKRRPRSVASTRTVAPTTQIGWIPRQKRSLTVDSPRGTW
jgi:hypothetical protein